MYHVRLFTVLMLLLSSLTFLSSCEETGESNDVEITLIPNSPLIINSDFTIIRADGEPRTITGPWFGFSYTIFNGATSPLVVVSFEMEITGRSNGATVTKSYTPDFGDFSAARTRITESSIAPDDSFDETVTWYVDDLPDGDSFRMNVKVTFVGYFEQGDDPATEGDESVQPGARFERTYRFSTR